MIGRGELTTRPSGESERVQPNPGRKKKRAPPNCQNHKREKNQPKKQDTKNAFPGGKIAASPYNKKRRPRPFAEKEASGTEKKKTKVGGTAKGVLPQGCPPPLDEKKNKLWPERSKKTIVRKGQREMRQRKKRNLLLRKLKKKGGKNKLGIKKKRKK